MVMSPGYHIVVLAATVMSSAPVVSQIMDGPVVQVAVDVGVMVGQIVEYHLTGCHLVLFTTTPRSYVSTNIIRHVHMNVETGLVVEEAWVFSQDQLAQDFFLRGLWGDITTTCRALILDLTTSNSTDLVLRWAEAAGLWRMPETRVVAVGRRARVKDFLLHHTFRNTLHVIYLAFQDLIPHVSPHHGNSRLMKITGLEASVSERVWVYLRCMYCNNGEADVQPIHQYNITSVPQPTDNLFTEQVKTLMGREMTVVAVPYFPYVDYTPLSDEPGGLVQLKDSIDTRILEAFATALNFTYEIREEPEKIWGMNENGTFTGMVGQLQREETDFTTITGISAERLVIIEFLRTYPSDLMTVTSLKPSLLPQLLSLIRPFEGDLWVALLLSVVAWGVCMWVLQRAWQWVTGGLGIKFSTSILYGWGALLEQPPSVPSASDSGRMLVGWWLVFCLVITTGFRSSLIAHMTVQGKTLPIKTFEDLVSQDNWKWATEPWLLKGIPLDFFSKNTNPVVQKLYKHMEVLGADEALHKVLKGGFSLVDFENYINIIVASRYADQHGNNPFYVSKRGVSILATFGWSLRKGAPFYTRFQQLRSRLEDAGLISYWTKEVMARRVKENREANPPNSEAAQAFTSQDDTREKPLGMQHMQGAFYLLFLGFFLAFLALLGEKLTHSRSLAL
ncbi:probable glutamate receptor [Homarus americanus]|uniref:probable glutamate receptor n=1 Tax=Homarus americanus TaxID=6706 RepID=UPI001C492C4D|nr:probable glutamate receptor [Homarus americanus]